MKILKRFDDPIFYTASAIVVQLVFFVCFLYYLSSHVAGISIACTVLNLLILVFLAAKDENPSYKIIWIIVILAVPIIGGILYLLIGYKRASRRLGIRIETEHARYLPLMQTNENVAKIIKDEGGRAAGIVNYLQRKCSFPVWENTSSKYYPIGEELYADMLAELRKAEKFIFMEYFIIEPGVMWNGILEILTEKAAQGLDVRVMYDDYGCIKTLPKNFTENLRGKGIKCMPMNPLMPFLNLAMNNRDHRKIMVIDGNVAFSGGINLADEYINEKIKYGHWKDTGIKIAGAAVWNFTEMFLELWNAFADDDKDIAPYKPEPEFISITQSDGFVLPFADSPVVDEAISQNIYMDILNQAKNYVYIFTPYLIIDNEMCNALRMAAKRGVDVRLITPGIPDKKLVNRVTCANYEPLLSAGVRIFEYIPGFSHAKSVVCDGEIAVVGTINMDFRSLYLHFECGALLYKTASVFQVKNDFITTLEKCREIKPENLKQAFIFRAYDSMIRVFSPLM